MGRGGRAGGGGGRSSGGRSGGGRSHSRSSGGRSSSGAGRGSFSSSSSRGSAPPPRRSSTSRGGYGAPPPPPPRHGYGAPPPPPPPRRRRYYRSGGSSRSGGSGCASIIAFIILIILILVIAGSVSNRDEAGFNERKVENATNKYYDTEFDNRGDVFLFYITYSEKLDAEAYWATWGINCDRYVDPTCDVFFDAYDSHGNTDVGIQLAEALDIYTNMLSNVVDKKVEDGKFIERCYDDELDYIDSKGKSELQAAAKRLYDATGIQFYVVTREYKTVNVGFIIASIVVIIIAFSVVKNMIKKNKEKKQKEMEDQLKILNTPLEEFGSVNDIDNLAKKYDNVSSSSSSGASSASSTFVNSSDTTETTVSSESDNASE